MSHRGSVASKWFLSGLLEWLEIDVEFGQILPSLSRVQIPPGPHILAKAFISSKSYVYCAWMATKPRLTEDHAVKIIKDATQENGRRAAMDRLQEALEDLALQVGSPALQYKLVANLSSCLDDLGGWALTRSEISEMKPAAIVAIGVLANYEYQETAAKLAIVFNLTENQLRRAIALAKRE